MCIYAFVLAHVFMFVCMCMCACVLYVHMCVCAYVHAGVCMNQTRLSSLIWCKDTTEGL